MAIMPKESAPRDFFEVFDGHQQLSWNDFGEVWFCVYCYHGGTIYGDLPKDFKCEPRPRPADWNYIYG